MPFVDPVTREKVKFNPDVIKEGFIPKDQLMSQWWNGEQDFQWDAEQYWPALLKMTSQVREKQKRKWKELGSRIGTSELELKLAADPEPSSEKVGELSKVAEPVVVNTMEVNMEATAA